MTRITWGNVGERFYEAGADQAVLYLEAVSGVPWNGLISVKESISGGEPTPYYHDGVKHLNVLAVEDFAATIDAFSSPSEFALCDGTGELANGLFVTQQPRKSFGLSYRTKIGNDVDGIDHGYKLHLVYNALASPSTRSNVSISDTVSPNILSWAITTIPVVIDGYRPSAHLIVDSRLIAPATMLSLEDLIYGDSENEAELPTPSELITLLGA